MRRFAFGILCALLSPALLGAQTPPPPARIAQVVDSLARAFVAQGGAPSVASGVARGGETIMRKGWGKADLENDVPAIRAIQRVNQAEAEVQRGIEWDNTHH